MRTVARQNYLAILASAVIAASAICHAPAARAQAVVPPQSESFPLTYGEWGARWWQYVFGIPEGENPLTDDPTGALCHLGQWGPVFFLMGTNSSAPVTRSCDVPADTGLFFPIINIACAIPDDGTTRAEIVAACSPSIDAVDTKSLFVTVDRKTVTIDGNTVQNFKKFRASEFFSFTGAVPGSAVNSCTGDPPHCYEGFRDTAFQDGYWAMLQPLSRGKHVVHFGGSIPSLSFTVDVTYRLNVVQQ
jgi:hypothetical protein